MERTSLKQKIVITGGAGFIGSHVTSLFCDNGYEVVVVDDLSFGFEKLIDSRATFIKGSIGDIKVLDEILPNTYAVIHLAASSIIKFSFERPTDYFQNNLVYPQTLLEGMRKYSVKKMIFSSSASVYGNALKQPISEDILPSPITIYGATKIAFENLLQGYFHAFGIESTSLRYFNAYGPHDLQKPATRAVPVWIQKILKNEPIPLFWKGNQFRDYVYAGDIARAHIAVLDLPGCNTFNIGSGQGILMKDLVKTLEIVSGKSITLQDAGQREGDPKTLVADISKIQKTVGWKPVTPLKEGLQKTYKYYAQLH